MNNNNKISVVINTYNAEKFLLPVLEAVKGFDEIVVCDMESTDDTCEIAASMGCKIVIFPKGKYQIAEPARTFAIQSASNKWVLVVDADEIVTPQLKEYLYKRIQNFDCPQGLYIPRRNRIMNVLKKGRLRDYQLRFFIREGTIWPPYPHTFPKVNGHIEKIPKKEDKAIFIHLATNYLSERINKLNIYTDTEVKKKVDKNYGVIDLFTRPAWRFFKSYFLNEEWRNGISGFIDSVLDSVYQFVMVSKIIESKLKAKQQDEK